jgi:hypothetical protein
MANHAAVVAGVISCRLVRAGGAALGASSHPGLGASVRLARLAMPTAACRRGGENPPPVTLAGLPLFPSEIELPANGDRPQERLRLIAAYDLEASYCLLDRHCGVVQQRLDRASDLLVLLEDATKELLNSSLLIVGVVAVLHHLLQQSVEVESKVINVLTLLEGQILPLLEKCLQCGLAGAVTTDACCIDGVPSLLGSPLL